MLDWWDVGPLPETIQRLEVVTDSKVFLERELTTDTLAYVSAWFQKELCPTPSLRSFQMSAGVEDNSLDSNMDIEFPVDKPPQWILVWEKDTGRDMRFIDLAGQPVEPRVEATIQRLVPSARRSRPWSPGGPSQGGRSQRGEPSQRRGIQRGGPVRGEGNQRGGRGRASGSRRSA